MTLMGQALHTVLPVLFLRYFLYSIEIFSNGFSVAETIVSLRYFLCCIEIFSIGFSTLEKLFGVVAPMRLILFQTLSNSFTLV